MYYSALIDLLSIPTLAEYSRESCESSLNKFSVILVNAIESAKIVITEKIQEEKYQIAIDTQGDRAFIESNDLSSLCVFLRILRNNLLSAQIFFSWLCFES